MEYLNQLLSWYEDINIKDSSLYNLGDKNWRTVATVGSQASSGPSVCQGWDRVRLKYSGQLCDPDIFCVEGGGRLWECNAICSIFPPWYECSRGKCSASDLIPMKCCEGFEVYNLSILQAYSADIRSGLRCHNLQNVCRGFPECNQCGMWPLGFVPIICLFINGGQ